MKGRIFYCFVAALLLTGLYAGAQSVSGKSNMTLYPEDKKPALSTSPKGYKLFYINHFGRHGSRTVSSSHIKELDMVWEPMLKASADGALSDKGRKVFQQVGIVYNAAKAGTGFLTDKGIQQHKSIARTLVAQYPDIFKESARIHVVSSIVPRCIMSMASFTNTVSSLRPGVQMSFECSPAMQCNINPYIPRSVRKESQKPERFADLKPGFDFQEQTAQYFNDAETMRRYVKDCDAFLYALFQMANNECNLDVEAHVSDYVDSKVFDYYVAKSNRVIYYQACNSAEFGNTRMELADTMACYMAGKIIDAVEGKSPDADLVFAHDYGLLAYLSLLDADCVPAALEPGQIDRRFDSSAIIPMAANLQQLFYRNAEGDVLVKFVLNGHEITLHGLKPVNKVYYKCFDVTDRLVRKATVRGSFDYLKRGPYCKVIY